MKINVFVIGDGGHSKVIQEMIRARTDMQVKGIFDDKFDGIMIKDQVYYGPVSSVHMLLQVTENIKFVIAVGDNRTRKALVSKLGLENESLVSLLHPTAVVSSGASIGHGTIVMPNAVINAGARVGNHAIINTCAVVEHDSTVENYAHICPNATLTGAVKVKEGAFIGAGATVIPGKTIGEWTIIGAGATVINDIPSQCTAVGTPARTIHGGEQLYGPNKNQEKNLPLGAAHDREGASLY